MDDPAAHLDALVAKAKSVELAFRIEFGLALFLVWGTLLGAVRGGDLIRHDFDVDMAYVGRAIRPFRQVSLRGVPFNAPKRSEAFLDQAIGPDWRVPRLPKDHADRTGRYPGFDFLHPSAG
jgi:hypothetical protein